MWPSVGERWPDWESPCLLVLKPASQRFWKQAEMGGLFSVTSWQDQLSNLQGPGQSENVWLLGKKLPRISGWWQQTLKPSVEPCATAQVMHPCIYLPACWVPRMKGCPLVLQEKNEVFFPIFFFFPPLGPVRASTVGVFVHFDTNKLLWNTFMGTPLLSMPRHWHSTPTTPKTWKWSKWHLGGPFSCRGLHFTLLALYQRTLFSFYLMLFLGYYFFLSYWNFFGILKRYTWYN